MQGIKNLTQGPINKQLFNLHDAHYGHLVYPNGI